MRFTLQNVLTGASALVVGALLVWAFLPTPVEVDAGRIVQGDLRVTVDHEGITRVKERYIVSSPLAGRMLRVELRPGDPVEADETLLAAIEPADPDLLDVRATAQAEARVDAAKAAQSQSAVALDRAQVLLAESESELNRVRELRARQAATPREYEVAMYRQQAAAADVRSAEFAVRIAEFELDQAESAFIYTQPRSSETADPIQFKIPAPISGVVLRVLQESATVVTPGTPIVEVGDPNDLECVVDVLSIDAVKVQPGQRVILDYWGGDHPLEGRVRVREPAAFTKISALGVEEQRVNIIIDLVGTANDRPALGDGYRVEAQVVIWEGRGILKAPAGALFRDGDEWAVFTIEDGHARLRHVKIGRSNGLETHVLDGLDEHDRVVLHPTDQVADGVAVTPL
ncbi:MAG: HlyD family efflux transporter periplasmic adaptor subunit [Planctomycetaceae bacterium]